MLDPSFCGREHDLEIDLTLWSPFPILNQSSIWSMVKSFPIRLMVISGLNYFYSGIIYIQNKQYSCWIKEEKLKFANLRGAIASGTLFFLLADEFRLNFCVYAWYNKLVSLPAPFQLFFLGNKPNFDKKISDYRFMASLVSVQYATVWRAILRSTENCCHIRYRSCIYKVRF